MKTTHLLICIILGAFGKLYGQYSETFDVPNKGYLENFEDVFSGVDWTMTSWPVDPGTSPFGRDAGDYFKTTAGGVLEAIDLDVEVCWVSPELVISGGTASFELDLTWLGFDANADYIDIEYRTDGSAAWTQVGNVVGGGSHTIEYTSGSGNNGSANNIGANGISGSTLQIRVCIDQNAGVEVVTLDNITAFNADVAPPLSCDLAITSIITTHEGCPNTNDGALNISATTSNGPLTYSISGPVNQSNATGLFTGLPDGNYNILVRDDAFTPGDCDQTATRTINAGVDNIPPTISGCPTNISKSNDLGLCTAVVTYATPTGSDNCGNLSIIRTAGPASGSAFPVGTTTVVYEASDAAGNTSECSFTVTVNDTEGPVVDCKDFSADLDQNGAWEITALYVINNGFVSRSDNCGVNPGVTATGPRFYSCNNLGPQNITLVTTDVNGNTTPCTVTLTINDPFSVCNQPPMAVCKDITVAVDGNCMASITPGQIDNGSNDPDGDPVNLSLDNNGPFSPGTYTVELTVSDGQLQSTCNATVIVEDYILPQITCPGNISVSTDPNTCGAVVNYTPPVGTDNCPGATTTQIGGLGSGATFPVGVTTEAYRVTDAAGNTKECSFTITVTDDQDPVLICPGNIVKSNDLNTCGAIVNFNPLSAVDNCPGAIITRLSGINTGSLFPVGVTTQKYMVVDASGNTDICEFTITVTDDQDPVLICPGNIVTTNDPNTCGAIVNFDPPSAVDNCPGAVITRLSGINTGSIFPVGVTTQKYMVVDASGNTDECEFTITVEDNSSPTAICQDITVQLDVMGKATINPSEVDNGSNDACGIGNLVVAPASFDCSNVGANAVVLTVTDIHSNTSTCTATVTIEDKVPPVAICQDITVQLDAAGNASISGGDVDNGSNDACGIASLSVSPNTFSCANIGNNTVTLTVTDNNVNMATCSATVTVEDKVPPIAICQDITVQLDASGNADISGSDVDNGSNDACGIASLSVSPNTFSCANIGNNTVTLTATDNNGNMATCTAKLTVEDNVPPIAICQDITVQLDASGNAGISGNDVDNGSNDACGIASLSVSPNTFTCAEVGANTVTLMATDNNGNNATCSANVMVEDNVPPVALCQDLTVFLSANGTASVSGAMVDNGSNDACGIASLTLNKTMFDCGDLGLNSVVLTVTDNNGNSSTCNAVITVEDIQIFSTSDIFGMSPVCPGLQGIPYSIEPNPDVTSYLWSYSGTGVTIHGNGTPNVTLDFAEHATPGKLKVEYITACKPSGIFDVFQIHIASQFTCSLANACLRDNLLVINAMINLAGGVNLFKARESVNSLTILPVGSSVIFRAGEEINLFPNFEVKDGTVFLAEIEGCFDNLRVDEIRKQE